MIDPRHTLETVKNYYGKILASSKDLQTSCCTAEAMPERLKPLLANVHPEVCERFYGCGSPFPLELEGRTILDLGCGSGRDCYLLSQLVGPEGRVVGVDMTEEQLTVAQRHLEYHAQKFGFANVTFRQGYIEDLESAGIASNSIDVVISNCVVNLSPDKGRVFSEIFRVLKPGGELFFSDVFANRRIPRELASDPVLLGECLGGALYTEDFRRRLLEIGVRDVRAVSSSRIELAPSIRNKVGLIDFSSTTYRAFKIEALEDRCEDYGQAAYYLGTIEESPHSFLLDDHHLFEKAKPLLVCSNTAAMLSETRFARHFKIVGDLSTHFGLFDCTPIAATTPTPTGGACC